MGSCCNYILFEYIMPLTGWRANTSHFLLQRACQCTHLQFSCPTCSSRDSLLVQLLLSPGRYSIPRSASDRQGRSMLQLLGDIHQCVSILLPQPPLFPALHFFPEPPSQIRNTSDSGFQGCAKDHHFPGAWTVLAR